MSNGKGDTPRPVHGDTFRRNFDLIFGAKPRAVRVRTWCDECWGFVGELALDHATACQHCGAHIGAVEFGR